MVNPSYNSISIENLTINPHLVGSFNDWDPANHDYDLILNENNIWTLDVSLPSGTHEYKVVESNAFDDNDWPGVNQQIILTADTEISFIANCGFNTGIRNWDEYVTHTNPIIVGNFLDTLGLGANWDTLNMSGMMFDQNGDGIYTWEVILPYGDWEYKVILNQNWDQDTYGGGGNFIVSSDGNSSTLFTYDFSQNSTYYIDACPARGDVNGDGGWNVLDIVSLANCVLTENCGYPASNWNGYDCGEDDNEPGTALCYGCAADTNVDGGWNVLDVVLLANCVLEQNCGGRIDDASHSKLIIDDNMVSIEADGFIGGVQMTLSHGEDFSIEMADQVLFADHLTSGNETRLLVITPETNKLFSYSGNFKISEIIVANSHAEVSIDLPLATSFVLSEAYPNPFNPTTTMTLTMPVSGDMQVDIYNLLGQVVTTLISGYKESGTYNLTWDASDVSSGMYFIKAQADGFAKTQKLMVVK